VTDAALVLSKLSTLREHVDRVRRRRPASAEVLRRDVDLQDAGLGALDRYAAAIVAFVVPPTC
jgi:hypothetical protein